MNGPAETRHLLVYDGGCPMCVRWARRIRRWDTHGRIELLPLDDPRLAERLPGLRRCELLRALHLVSPTGEVRKGAAAVEELGRLLPRAAAVAWLFRVPLARPVARLVYRSVAAIRRRDACGEPGCA